MLILLVTTMATAQTITVKQDGTGMFTAIQEAIDAAASGDTILVWPGTYYENLYIEGKNLTLGSLNLTTGDPAYIAQTIIDGNNSGSCIVLWRNITALIQGFTIQHGSGLVSGLGTTAGGGINIYYRCFAAIKNCVIQNNMVNWVGGGIISAGSSLFISGTSIKNNFASSAGGGVACLHLHTNLASLEFDEQNPCSIFSNFSPKGNELIYNNDLVPNGYHLDTFSVSNPNRYHAFQLIEDNDADDSVRLTYNVALTQSINDHLFVDPVNGSNENSGTSKDLPLKSLTYAMSKIDNNFGNHLNIYLNPGIYSSSTNGEFLPLSLRSRISLVGSGPDATIIDGSNTTNHIYSNYYQNDVSISGLSLINGNGDVFNKTNWGSVYLYADNNILFDNVHIMNNQGYNSSFYFNSCDSITLSNCKFSGNHGGKALRTGTAYNIGANDRLERIYITNTVFSGNLPLYDSIIPYGGALISKGTYLLENPVYIHIVGCLFSENITDMNDRYGASITMYDHVEAVFVNTTIGNNQMINFNTNPIMHIGTLTQADMRNCVFYGNSPSKILLYNEGENTSQLSISHSLIEGGESAISGDLVNNTLVYDVSNIDTDPLWVNYGEFPYALSGLSPCIDAGTMDLPEGISLPATDLAGNPRVWGGSVDMGAYEFNPVSIGESRLQPQAVARMVASPNPFTHEISITAQLTTAVSARITVHNLLGREVACLMEQSSNRLSLTSLQWDGRSSTGDILPAGVYLISLSENNKPVASLRVVKE